MKNKNFEKELPKGYTEVKHIDAKNAKFGLIFNLIAMAVLLLVVAAAALSLLPSGRLAGVFDMNLPQFVLAYVVFFALMFVYIILHELVHGIAYKALTGERLTFGVSWSCAFCGVPNIYTYRKTALISVIAPFLTFTVIFIPVLIALYFISPLYYLIAAFIFGLHLGGCSGDLYVTYLLTVKYKDKMTLMRDTGPEQFFYVPCATEREAYLFDFDGTLVDSMPTFVSVMLRILDEHGIEYGDDIVKIITPLGYHGTAKYYRELGISTPTEELIQKMNEYAREDYELRIPLKDGVSTSLRELKRRGASLNVLTASPHLVLDPCLKRLGIWDLFDNIWSCDDFNTTKSNPEIYRAAAEKMGREVSGVIFIDDNVNAVKTARLAGMKAYGIYDDSSRELVEEMKAESDRYIYSFEELI